MTKRELSKLLHGQKPSWQELMRDKITAAPAGKKFVLFDAQMGRTVTYEKTLDGMVECYVDYHVGEDKSKLKYDYKYDPIATQYDPKWLDPWGHFDKTKYTNWYINMPRGFGKNAALNQQIKKLAKAHKEMGKAVDKAKTGLEVLREANDEWVKKEQAAYDSAEKAVTDERVKEFAEANYLPLDYARVILVSAHADSILNERNPDDPAESSAEADPILLENEPKYTTLERN